jgi:hypothetical protein
MFSVCFPLDKSIRSLQLWQDLNIKLWSFGVITEKNRELNLFW